MLDPDQTRERTLLLQRLRELNAQRIEKEIGDQERALELLEERYRQVIERLTRTRD